MNMLEIIGIAFMSLTIFCSIKYAVQGKKEAEENKIAYTFGIKSNGTSLDEREIYALSSEELGL